MDWQTRILTRENRPSSPHKGMLRQQSPPHTREGWHPPIASNAPSLLAFKEVIHWLRTVANLSIRRLDEETVTRLKMRAEREGVSVEETVRRILRTAVVDEEPLGSLIRRIVGKGLDLDLPKREPDIPIDFSTDDYGRDR